jgi:AraC-like DNA-binding protein
MHGNPAEPWTLEELGNRVGLSRSALHERFVTLTGLAPMQYLTNWRMQCGARLLREGHLSVAAVALEVAMTRRRRFHARSSARRICRRGPGGGAVAGGVITLKSEWPQLSGAACRTP